MSFFMERNAEFSDCRKYRFYLSRQWMRNVRVWCSWLMLNPSKAGEVDDDPTIKRVIRFSRAWGYDACYVVNLVPYVSSSPAAMLKWYLSDHRKDELITHLNHNLNHVRKAGQAHRLIVAFGVVPEKAKSLLKLVECYSGEGEEDLYCLGQTKDGWPLHPMARGKMRVPDNAQLKPFLSPFTREAGEA